MESTASRSSIRAMANAGGLVFAASMMLSAGGFAFHAIASRKLGVADYGVLYALISLFNLAGLPVAIFTPVVTKFSAEFAALHDDAHVRGLIQWLVRIFVVVGLVYVVAAALLAAPLGGFLHLAPLGIVLVGAMLAVGIFSGTLRAIGQGIQAFDSYSVSVAGEGIIKVASVAVAALGGLTAFGALGAFLCGMLAGGTAIAVPLVNRYRNVAAAAIVLDWRRIFATIAGAAVLTLMMTCMGFADVIIVKHFFSAHDAGLYSVLSLCGKVVLYFVGFVPAVLMPQATHRHAKGERTRRILWVAIAFTIAVSIIGLLADRIAGSILLHALAGNAFDAALPLLPMYASAMAVLALTNLLGSYAIATHRLTFAAPLSAATFLTLIAIAVYHPSLQLVVEIVLVGNACMLAATAIPLTIQGLRAQRT